MVKLMLHHERVGARVSFVRNRRWLLDFLLSHPWGFSWHKDLLVHVGRNKCHVHNGSYDARLRDHGYNGSSSMLGVCKVAQCMLMWHPSFETLCPMFPPPSQVRDKSSGTCAV
jgi:hypothetical protein